MSRGRPRLDADLVARGARELARRDPALAPWIDHVEPHVPARPRSHFRMLLRAIVSQQLSDKAAATIVGRFLALFEGSAPRPEEVSRLSPEQLRAVGLSRGKADYVHELARAFTEGPLSRARFARMSDEDVIAALTSIRGIGRWTAEMFLIFSLRRPDVFSSGDLALRRGIERVERVGDLSPAECEMIAERWRPWRSVASLYLWRVAHAPSEPPRLRKR